MNEDSLKQILDFTQYRKTLSNQLQHLREQARSNLMVYANGGCFTVSQELIGFVQSIITTRPKLTEVVILDDNSTPIKVKIKDFHAELLDKYFGVVNDYHDAYEKIRQSRDVKSILDITDE